MANKSFDPSKVLGLEICELSRKELCELAGKLCEVIKSEAGPGAYRGGIYPENISLDEEGGVALGKGKKSDWSRSELSFLAPELFWKGESSPASDVYSLGMLLYYACSGGKLPFAEAGADEAKAGAAQQKRMNGEAFPAPASAGRRLGDIITKATRFAVHERYQSMDELKAVLDSCVRNLYLKGAPSAETIFNKSDDDLSDVERMMISIIEKEDREPEKPVKPDEEPEAQPPQQAAEPEEAVSEEAAPEEAPAEISPEEPSEEEIRIYQPIKAVPEKKELPEKKEVPELEPIDIERRPKPSAARTAASLQFGNSMERERKINEQMKKRKRRPVVIILVLCALLIVAAIIVNAVMNDLNPSPKEPDEQFVDFGPQPTATPAPTPTPAPTETPAPVREHGYQLVIEDVSWTEARAKCEELGGHLAVITSADEFVEIVELAEANDVNKLWIGCHRIDGELIWETNETGYYYQWDTAIGEPSGFDYNDNVSEDYVMLWYRGGWYYNDSRNNPVADYPEMYSGQLAYVCEFEAG